MIRRRYVRSCGFVCRRSMVVFKTAKIKWVIINIERETFDVNWWDFFCFFPHLTDKLVIKVSVSHSHTFESMNFVFKLYNADFRAETTRDTKNDSSCKRQKTVGYLQDMKISFTFLLLNTQKFGFVGPLWIQNYINGNGLTSIGYNTNL